MRGIVGEVQVEGVLGVALEEVDRFVSPVVRQVASVGAQHAVAAFEPPVIVVVHTTPEADGLVEAALFRLVARVEGTQVPLANQPGAVAGVAEDVGDRDFVEVEALEPAPLQGVDRTGAVRVASGEQRCARRVADRRAGVVLRQAGALLNELIKEGGFADAVVEAAEVAVAEVVDEDMNDVGACHVVRWGKLSI